MHSAGTIALVSVRNSSKIGKILKDLHSEFKEQFNHDIKLSGPFVVVNDAEVIAKEINRVSSQYFHVVILLENIHCSEVFKGVASAFSETLIRNEYLHDFIHRWPKNGFNETTVSETSLLPSSSVVHDILNQYENLYFPIVSSRNVHVFLGISALSSQHILTFFKHIFNESSRCLYLKTQKYQDVVKQCQACKEHFNDKICFILNHIACQDSVYNLKLSIEADSVVFLDEIESYLRSLFLTNIIVGSLHPRSEESLKKFEDFENSPDNKIPYLFGSIDVIEECLRRYTPDNICLSFNGGKDCTALLHVVSCVFLRNGYTDKLKVFYVQSKDSFSEIEEFVHQCVERYDLELLTYSYPIRNALAELKTAHPEMKAVLMGTRSTDPRAADLKVFQITDSEWPQIMRVNPLLRWEYTDVWRFLRHLDVPYCCLYDHGYTSLGCRYNTVPNPKLRRFTQDGKEYFCPAYLLDEPNNEREGRCSNL